MTLRQPSLDDRSPVRRCLGIHGSGRGAAQHRGGDREVGLVRREREVSSVFPVQQPRASRVVAAQVPRREVAVGGAPAVLARLRQTQALEGPGDGLGQGICLAVLELQDGAVRTLEDELLGGPRETRAGGPVTRRSGDVEAPGVVSLQGAQHALLLHDPVAALPHLHHERQTVLAHEQQQQPCSWVLALVLRDAAHRTDDPVPRRGQLLPLRDPQRHASTRERTGADDADQGVRDALGGQDPALGRGVQGEAQPSGGAVTAGQHDPPDGGREHQTRLLQAHGAAPRRGWGRCTLSRRTVRNWTGMHRMDTAAATREILKRVTRAAGTSTATWRPLPDFLIIGAKRGGTTSLYFDLLEHPGIVPLFPPPVPGLKPDATKGVHYFDSHATRSETWYRSYFPTRLNRARHARRLGYEPITGEASPYYLFHPAAVDRAAALVPHVPIIAQLRDPVVRTYSHWKERRRQDAESLDFLSALYVEPERLAGEREKLLADPTYRAMPRSSRATRPRASTPASSSAGCGSSVVTGCTSRSARSSSLGRPTRGSSVTCTRSWACRPDRHARRRTATLHVGPDSTCRPKSVSGKVRRAQPRVEHTAGCRAAVGSARAGSARRVSQRGAVCLSAVCPRGRRGRGSVPLCSR